jgi:hypothetical protein
MYFFRFAMLLVLAAASSMAADPLTIAPKGAPDWLKRVNAGEPGFFPFPRPFQVVYRVSWSNLTAARIEVSSGPAANNGEEIETRLKASTAGAARSLWQMDAIHRAVANRRTLRPVRFDQTDKRAKKQLIARVEFTPEGASRWSRTLTKNDDPAAPEPPKKPKTFNYPGLFDIHSTLLYVRSLRLANGDSVTLPLMTSTNPYLITVKVAGRETVKVAAGRFPAIKCTLALERIGKTGEIEAHKRFKSASIWISDDQDRMPLKVETQVFIGSVTMELEKATFPADSASH